MIRVSHTYIYIVTKMHRYTAAKGVLLIAPAFTMHIKNYFAVVYLLKKKFLTYSVQMKWVPGALHK